MAQDVDRASPDPDWPRAIAAIEHASIDTAVQLSRFSSRSHAHHCGNLTASDLYATEVEYQRARRMLRRVVQRAALFLQPRHSRWRAASLLCAVAAEALSHDAVDRDVVIAIQVDVTQWALEHFETRDRRRLR